MRLQHNLAKYEEILVLLEQAGGIVNDNYLADTSWDILKAKNKLLDIMGKTKAMIRNIEQGEIIVEASRKEFARKST